MVGGFMDEFVLDVAPLVGAWIEIITRHHSGNWQLVAPLVGAWIEILYPELKGITVSVAPLVGAWIEI